MDSHCTKKLKKPFEEVITKVTESLQKQGFGIITSIDVKDTLKKKLGINFRNYKILGACNPEFAYKVISIESHSGLMLPCNILVQEHENGEVELTAENPMEKLTDTLNLDITGIAEEISQRLRTAVNEVN
ncbi:MAG TPA: DUF302 domain-containing protein [Cyclobacteriaceae bacterium]|nr:DUF302 domain-containing protein [Cyclobacteriaceae bacterium]